MKKILHGAFACVLILPAIVGASDAVTSEKLATYEDKLSYSIGLDIGTSLQTIGEDVKLEMVKKGLSDAFEGKTPLMNAEEITATQQQFAMKMQTMQMQKIEEMKVANAAAGAAFLEENKKKEGVQVTESGLQYEVLQAAEGEKPKASDTVKVDYVGTLVDGTEFDSSVKRGEPAVFGVDKVIPGWTEALQLMPVGAKYRFVIPSDLAYGETGAPPVIEPNAVLVFEVDLLSIEPAAE